MLPRSRNGLLSAYVCMICLAVICPGTIARAATPRQVDEAVKKAVDYLWSQQRPDGSWELPEQVADRSKRDHTYGGYTALCVYALLSAGEKHQDPRLTKAIDFLKKADMTGTYAIGIRCQVWLLLGTAESHSLLQADAARLQSGIGRDGEAKGLWDYISSPAHVKDRGTRYDHSVSQYGVLGLWAAAQGGVKIDAAYWTLFDAVWHAHEDDDGGWSYQGNGKDHATSTISMSAAGVATLFITQDMVGSGPGPWVRGNLFDPAIQRGLAWISHNWSDAKAAYGLYGIERIGTASGYKYLGKVDWYNAGTARFLEEQAKDGSWFMQGAKPLSDTAFGILFLSHGRAPVLMNKLNYGITGRVYGAETDMTAPPAGATTAPAITTTAPAIPEATTQPQPSLPLVDAPWNQRPRDAANLVHFAAHNAETMLNWQIVNLGAPVSDFHDAPVLYLSGNKALDLRPDEEAKLKQFVEEGGLIFANSDVAVPARASQNDPFPRSVIQLGEKLFGGKFRPVPPTHPLMAEEQYRSTRWTNHPLVLGLSNGVRELIVLVPSADAGQAWQRNNPRTDAWAFELGTDVCLYASDKENLRRKGVTYMVTPPPAAPAFNLPIARLAVGANWDPEPGGWRRLDAIFRRDFAASLATQPVGPDLGKLKNFKIAHLTGTTAFQLTPVQRQELMGFVNAGGTLIVDAAGGSPAFADSAEKELALLFGGTPGQLGTVLTPEDPLYHLPGAAIKSVDYRNYLRRHAPGRLNVPRLRAIQRGGRNAVFFSREDLSAGLVGEPMDGILGYTPDSATDIMRNIILYAMSKAKAP